MCDRCGREARWSVEADSHRSGVTKWACGRCLLQTIQGLIKGRERHGVIVRSLDEH